MNDADAYRTIFLANGTHTATTGRLAAANAQRPSDETARNAEIEAWRTAGFFPVHARQAYEGG